MAVKRGGKLRRAREEARQVATLAQYGVSASDIAYVLGLPHTTVLRLYADELAAGFAKANARVAKRLFEKALDGDNACLIFWCKARMGWRERDREREREAAPARDWKEAFAQAMDSVG